jgi:hypothetical protein
MQSASTKAVRARNYLAEHSVGSILRCAMQIFAAHFGTIFLVLFLPTFPVTILQQAAMKAGNTALATIAALASFAVGLFAFGALMIVISDVCLGNRPSIGHAYRRVFGTVAGKLALTNIAQSLVLFLAFLLLIVPGLVAMVWLLFVSPVVVLEGKWGFEAFKRSKRLGDGFHWRNTGALLLLLVCLFVVGVVMSVLCHFMLGTLEHWLFRTLIAAIQLGVTQPLGFITIGLLYYDLRVRKESYDVASLAEELRDEIEAGHIVVKCDALIELSDVGKIDGGKLEIILAQHRAQRQREFLERSRLQEKRDLLLGGDLIDLDDELDIIQGKREELVGRLQKIRAEQEADKFGVDEVTCSVFSPRLAAPGDEILVQAYAHLPGQEEKVAAMAEHADLAASLRGSQPLAEPVARGAKLGFHLRMRGVEVDETDIVLAWRGEPLAAQFGVFFPEDFQPRSVNATVQVTKDGVPIGHVKFTLQVVTGAEKQRADAAAAREMLGTLSRYGEAYVSYASQDRPEVLPMVQALSAARIKIFHDILELNPGDRWAQVLYKHIETCDAFFLFWSKAAKASEWVLREALYARDRQSGKDDTPPEIIPIIIEGPPPVKPPPELNFLHFNDKFIYLRKGVEVEAAKAGTIRGRTEKQKLRERAYRRYDTEIQRIEAKAATAQRKTALKRAATNDLEEEIEKIDRMP